VRQDPAYWLGRPRSVARTVERSEPACRWFGEDDWTYTP
jgi:hypothetical protein